MEQLWFLSEVCSWIVWCIIIPIAVYGNVKLSLRNKEMFIKKRSVSILYGLNISFILGMIAMMICQIVLIHCPLIIWLFAASFYFVAIWCILFFLLTKNWMIHFKYKWTYYTMQTQWQQLINSQHRNINWYIMHNKTYGNLYYIYKIFGILCSIGFILCMTATCLAILTQLNYTFVVIAFSLFVIAICPSMLSYVYIVWKTPWFDDIFYIHWESKIHAKLLLLLAVLYCCTNVVVIFTKDFKVYSIAFPVLGSVLFAMNYVSTFVISNKNKTDHIELGIVSKPSSSSFNVNKKITLEMIIENEKAFNMFMVHLSKEYSMELLLSLIEFEQFEKYLINHMNDEEAMNIDQQNHIILASSIPISGIVEYDEESKEIEGNIYLYNAKIKAHKLYKKYIEINSEFELNLSSPQRNEVTFVLNDLPVLLERNVNLMDLYILFESCKQIMVSLLRHSLSRYKSAKEFSQIILLCGTHESIL